MINAASKAVDQVQSMETAASWCRRLYQKGSIFDLAIPKLIQEQVSRT